MKRIRSPRMKPSKNKTINQSLAGKSVIKPRQLAAHNMTSVEITFSALKDQTISFDAPSAKSIKSSRKSSRSARREPPNSFMAAYTTNGDRKSPKKMTSPRERLDTALSARSLRERSFGRGNF